MGPPGGTRGGAPGGTHGGALFQDPHVCEFFFIILGIFLHQKFPNSMNFSLFFRFFLFSLAALKLQKLQIENQFLFLLLVRLYRYAILYLIELVTFTNVTGYQCILTYFIKF